VKNALAYYGTLFIMTLKSLIVQAPEIPIYHMIVKAAHVLVVFCSKLFKTPLASALKLYMIVTNGCCIERQ
jgi:hypothetical protein